MATRETMSVKEAATRLGISRSSAYELAREGTIPTLRLGRALVVPVAALDRLLGAGGPALPAPDMAAALDRATTALASLEQAVLRLADAIDARAGGIDKPTPTL